jgi:iron-sulfur cluster assembly protein/iron-sulfur cluster insertion protein
VYVEQGGCAGMQYGLVFDEDRPNDLRVEFQGVTVLVDPISAGYVQGARIDYRDALMDGGFKLVNPNARETCGCGKSFQAP